MGAQRAQLNQNAMRTKASKVTKKILLTSKSTASLLVLVEVFQASDLKLPVQQTVRTGRAFPVHIVGLPLGKKIPFKEALNLSVRF